ncbi:Serine/threonine-protein kinase SMG1 [Oopsacas minuta]|uniref:non-specific serine/threonine protein kinase n=1 Tax=Oopsacas minuta TaxID=111878 RepID=A0AAV7JNN0_9METZ|nr:Serine/threonine-protein kinase SMG1 [Oopsacas minuta]
MSTIEDELEWSPDECDFKPLAFGPPRPDRTNISKWRRWLKQASAYAEAPLRVCALEWPIVLMPYHGLQLQVIAAIRAAHPEKFRLSQPVGSALNTLGLYSMKLDPFQHDLAIWVHIFMLSKNTPNVNALSINNILISLSRLARKQGNIEFAEFYIHNLVSKTLSISSKLSFIETCNVLHSKLASFSSSIELQEINLPLYYECSKLLYCKNEKLIACQIIISSYANYLLILDNLSILSREYITKMFSTLSKWFQADVSLFNLVSHDTSKGPGLSSILFVGNLLSQELTWQDCITGLLQRVASELYSSGLAKAWLNFAKWNYAVGEKLHNNISSMNIHSALLSSEEESILNILPADLPEKERFNVITTCSKMISQIIRDDDILEQGERQYNIHDSNRVFIVEKLCLLFPSLKEHPCPPKLIDIIDDILKRVFASYNKSVQAYFTFLSKSLEQNMERNTILATLRLLRLTEKYYVEMKQCFYVGYYSTPPVVWKKILPQLISKLDHKISGVRHILTSLLSRISEFWPHLLLYKAILSNPISNSSTIKELDHSKDNTTSCCLSNVLECISQRNGAMVSITRCLINEFQRVTLLWDELWFACLSSIHNDFIKALHQFEFELRKLLTSNLDERFLAKLMDLKYQILMSPLLHVLESLVEIISKSPETPFEQTFQNNHNIFIRHYMYVLREPNDLHSDSRIRDAFKLLLDLFVSLHQKQSLNQMLNVFTLSPALYSIVPDIVFLPGITTIDDKPITLTKVCSEISIQPTKTRPKKIGFHGSDGKHHNFLFKGLEDLHLDQTIMQMLSIINRSFLESNSHQRGLFQARHYAVTPLGDCSGIIEWVNNATPIFTLYKRCQLNKNTSQRFDNTDLTDVSDKGCHDNIPPIKPKEIFYSKINSYLEFRGISIGPCYESTRKSLPKDILREVFLELQYETPSILISSELWYASSCAGEWWVIQQSFCRSLAVMSIIGYIIGLGDRHLDNILLDFATGEIIHVDYNVCFENGQKLRVPEMVPFRLTQNFRRALGPSDIEGTFRNSCENVLLTLMKEEEIVLSLLQTIEYYPLTDFTDGTSIDQWHILDRFFVDRTLGRSIDDETFLSMTVIDSWQEWKHVFLQSIRDLDILNHHFRELQSISSDIRLLDESITSCKKQVNNLSGIQSNTFNNIICVIVQLNSTREELNDALSNLRSKILTFMPNDYTPQSCEQMIQTNRIASIGCLLKNLLISKIPEDLSQLFTNSFGSYHQQDLVIEYSASYNQLINVFQCSVSIVQEILSILDEESSLSRLKVCSYSPNWIHCLDTFIVDSTLDNCTQVISALNKCFEQYSLTREYVTTRLSKLLQSLFNQENTLETLQERFDHLSITLSPKEPENVNHIYKCISKWVHQNDHMNSKIILYLIGVSLPEKFEKWYSMELTAKNSGNKLCELMSEEGDWFLEELCTMSGNVYQMLRCAKIGLYHLAGPGFSALTKTVRSLKVVNKIFCHMRGLYHDFQRDFMDLLIEIHQSADIQHIFFHLDEIIGNSDLTSLIAESTKLYRDVLQSTFITEKLKVHSNAIEIFDRIVKSLNNRFNKQNSPTCKLVSLIFRNYLGLMKLVQEYDYTSWKGNALSLKYTLHEFQQSQLLETFVHPNNRQILADLFLFKYIQTVYEILNTGKDMLSILTVQSSNFTLPFYTESNILRPLQLYLSDFLILKLVGSPTQALLSISLNIMDSLDFLPSINVGDSLDVIVKQSMESFFQQHSDLNFTHVNELITNFDIAWRKMDMKNRLETSINLTKCKIVRTKDYIDAYRLNNVFYLNESTLISKITHWIDTLTAFNLCNLSLTRERIIEKIQSIDSNIIEQLKMNPELTQIYGPIQTGILKRNIFITDFRYLMNHMEKLYIETLRFNKFRLNSEEFSSFGKSITKDLIEVKRLIDKLNLIENSNKFHYSLYKFDVQNLNNPTILDLKLHLNKEELSLFQSRLSLVNQISKYHLTISKACIPVSKLSKDLTKLFSLVHANITNMAIRSSSDTWSRINIYFLHGIDILDSLSTFDLGDTKLNELIMNVDLLKSILKWAIGFLLCFSASHLGIDNHLLFDDEYFVMQNPIQHVLLGYKLKALIDISLIQDNVLDTSDSIASNILRTKDFSSSVCKRVHLKIQGQGGVSSTNHSVTNQVNVLIQEAVNVENLSQMLKVKSSIFKSLHLGTPLSELSDHGTVLTDKTIHAFMVLLLNQFPHLQGLQNIIEGHYDVFKTFLTKSLQIYHDAARVHWLVVIRRICLGCWCSLKFVNRFPF